ncbi:uncharacterized protein CPUR_08573 [Claviceps purpurea 20.1]|uniref:Uncharacterized protein n=1 Tax=Claviceps purpurea (strain 20.1) TaxID=1111077 RepID=M1WIK5_CLAP2|nr:uncharacterized protein CPUR_08573 [Claviceps purpurea 20.1]
MTKLGMYILFWINSSL